MTCPPTGRAQYALPCPGPVQLALLSSQGPGPISVVVACADGAIKTRPSNAVAIAAKTDTRRRDEPLADAETRNVIQHPMNNQPHTGVSPAHERVQSALPRTGHQVRSTMAVMRLSDWARPPRPG